MMKSRFFPILILLTLILLPGLAAGDSLLPPDKFFGFPMGADRKLIDWKQISDYFLKLGDASDRVIVKELGKTTLDKPFLLAIISSADNIKNIEHYKAIQQQLANPYDLLPDKAKSLIKEGKTIVLLSLNIHSTEIASSQESVELAYELATRGDKQVKKILDNRLVQETCGHPL